MQVGRCQVDDNLFARHPKALGMQGRYGAKETFFDSSVSQTDQMDADAVVDVNLDGNGDCVDSDAFRPSNMDDHGLIRKQGRSGIRSDGSPAVGRCARHREAGSCPAVSGPAGNACLATNCSGA